MDTTFEKTKTAALESKNMWNFGRPPPSNFSTTPLPRSEDSNSDDESLLDPDIRDHYAQERKREFENFKLMRRKEQQLKRRVRAQHKNESFSDSKGAAVTKSRPTKAPMIGRRDFPDGLGEVPQHVTIPVERRDLKFDHPVIVSREGGQSDGKRKKIDRSAKGKGGIRQSNQKLQAALLDGIADARASTICKYFQKGKCFHDDKCNYLHVGAGGVSPSSPPPDADKPEVKEVKLKENDVFGARLDRKFLISSGSWCFLPFYREIEWTHVRDDFNCITDQRVLNHQPVETTYNNARKAVYNVTTRYKLMFPSFQRMIAGLVLSTASAIVADECSMKIVDKMNNYGPSKLQLVTSFRKWLTRPSEVWFTVPWIGNNVAKIYNPLSTSLSALFQFTTTNLTKGITFVPPKLGTLSVSPNRYWFSRLKPLVFEQKVNYPVWVGVGVLLSGIFLTMKYFNDQGRYLVYRETEDEKVMSQELTAQLINTDVGSATSLNTVGTILDRISNQFAGINIDRVRVEAKQGSKLYAKQFFAHNSLDPENMHFHNSPVVTENSTNLDIIHAKNLETKIMQLNRAPSFIELINPGITNGKQFLYRLVLPSLAVLILIPIWKMSRANRGASTNASLAQSLLGIRSFAINFQNMLVTGCKNTLRHYNTINLSNLMTGSMVSLFPDGERWSC